MQHCMPHRVLFEEHTLKYPLGRTSKQTLVVGLRPFTLNAKALTKERFPQVEVPYFV